LNNNILKAFLTTLFFVLINLLNVSGAVEDTLSKHLAKGQIEKFHINKKDSISKAFTYHFFYQKEKIVSIKCLFDSASKDLKIIDFKPEVLSKELFNKANILIIVSDTGFEKLSPVVELKIIKIGDKNLLKDKLSYFTSLYDTVKVKSLLNNPIGLSYRTEIGINPNLIQTGSQEIPNPNILHELSFKNKIYGLPFQIDYFYSNARVDPGFNIRDIQFSVDFNEFKKELLNKQQFTNIQLQDYKSQVEMKSLQFKIQDSLLNQLNTEINDPSFDLDYSEQLKIIDKYNSIDSLDDSQKAMKLSAMNRIEKLKKKSEIKDSLVKSIEATKADIKQIQNKIEKTKAETEQKIGYYKNEFNRFSGFHKRLISSINNFQIGKVNPIFSDLSINSVTVYGIDFGLDLNKWKLKFTGGQIDPNLNPWIQKKQNVLFSQLEKTTSNGSVFFNLGSTFVSKYFSKPQSAIVGVGFQQNWSSIALYGEYALSLLDSFNPEKRLNNLDKDFLHKQAFKLKLNWQLAKNFNSETQVSFWGLGYSNSLIMQPRRDLLRLEQKFKYSFEKIRSSLGLNLKLESSNISKRSVLSVNSIFRQIIWSSKIGKNWQLKLDYLDINMNLNSDNEDFFKSMNSKTQVFTGVVTRTKYKTKTKVLKSSTFIVNGTKYFTQFLSNEMWSFSNQNLLKLEKLGLTFMNQNSFSKGGMDSLSSFQTGLQVSFSKNFLTLAPGAGYNKGFDNSDWIFCNLNLKFSFKNIKLVLTSYYDNRTNNLNSLEVFRHNFQIFYQL
jgi:hypothetical protein